MRTIKIPTIRSTWQKLVQNTAARRTAMLVTVTVAIIGILVVTGIVSATVAVGHRPTSDRIALVGEVITAATLLLAAVAGLVAVLAYALSTGAPNLEVKVTNAENPYRQPTIDLGPDDSINVCKDEELAISLRNVSSYSARNPVVTVRMVGFIFSEAQSVRDWEIIDWNPFRPDEKHKVQWDGGVDYSVHGRSTRRLPPLQLRKHNYRFVEPGTPRALGRVYRKPIAPGWEIEILAEGYRRVVIVPVRIRRGTNTIWPGGGWKPWM